MMAWLLLEPGCRTGVRPAEEQGDALMRLEQPDLLENNLMKLKKASLAVAIAAVCMVGPASAAIYGGAHLLVENLQVGVFNDDSSLATIQNFDFRITTSSDLNGVTATGQNLTCSGTPGDNTCRNPLVSPAGDVLGPAASNTDLIGGTNSHTPGVFSLLGPDGGQYGSSTNVIRKAQLVGDATTEVEGIAEAELVSGTSAGATSTIRSTTGYTFTFTLGGTGSLSLAFDADPYLYAELIDPTASGGTASASLTTTFNLTGPDIVPGLATSVSWAPRGLDAVGDPTRQANCVGIGASCLVLADSQNLQQNVTAPFGGSDSFSTNGGVLGANSTQFGIFISGLAAGTYSFTLAATQEANVTRTAIPEPSTLALFGAALLGLGAVVRRRKLQG